MDYAAYLRTRMTELRMRLGVSEYQMSMELGQNKNYIQGISSGKALPSMTQFFNICDYFKITPMQFFDGENLHPQLVYRAMEDMKSLNDADILLILSLIQRLKHDQSEKA